MVRAGTRTTTGTAAWLQPGQLWRVCLSRSCRPDLLDLNIQRRFSRDFIYGGSASYTIPALDFPGSAILYGDIFHFSAAYTPHKTFWTGQSFAAPPNVIKPTRIGEINLTLDGERYVRWSQKFPSMYLLGEWNYKSRSTVISDVYEPSMAIGASRRSCYR